MMYLLKPLQINIARRKRIHKMHGQKLKESKYQKNSKNIGKNN